MCRIAVSLMGQKDLPNSLLFLGRESDSDTFSEPRSQKGLDRYLDSLFDPVLSYGNGVRKTPLQVNLVKEGVCRVAAQGKETQPDRLITGYCLRFFKSRIKPGL